LRAYSESGSGCDARCLGAGRELELLRSLSSSCLSCCGRARGGRLCCWRCCLSLSLCVCVPLCLSAFLIPPAAAAAAAASGACAGTVATNDSYSFQSAVCAEHPMAEGAHYVEMTLLEEGYAFVGVVGQGFDAAGGGEARLSAEGWLLRTGSGFLYHDGRRSKWEGMPRQREIKQGDVVGLLLDLGQRTLSVYLNGARRGVMVAPGMKDTRREAVASLAGPLQWAVDMGLGASVRIKRKAPPPSPAGGHCIVQ
jgi:hypothetical protein